MSDMTDYQTSDDRLGMNDAAFGGNVLKLWNSDHQVLAIVEAVLIVALLGMVLYVVSQSTAGSMWILGVSLAVVAYFIWVQIEPLFVLDTKVLAPPQ
jgi:hypothetical protein